MKILTKIAIIIPLLALGIFTLIKFQNKNNKVKIGIIQIVEHESLDKAKQGFMDEMKKLGYNADFDVQVAGGDLSNCISISQKFVNDKKDLILAISTPCAQSVMKSTKDIPIVATAITDFKAAGLAKTNENPGKNITGASDVAPIDKIIDIIPKLNPNVKTIGVLYSTSDPSPKYQAELALNKISELGLKSEICSISQANEIQEVAENLANKVDALYVPIDKITSSAMPQISQIFLNHGKFVVCAEDAMISKGATATYGVDYYELGKINAKQADQILKGIQKPENMPIQYFENSTLKLNDSIIKKLNLANVDNLR